MKHYNFLIVGQGLAGSLLTYQLIKQNKSFLVIDDNSKLSSSKVAAGMFCPVGGKRMLKTWLADNLIEKLDKVYTELETFLNTTFYYKQDIIQYFNDNELENFKKVINIPKNDERSIYIDLNKKTFKLNYHSNKKEIKLTICEYLIKLLKQITNDENKINGSVLTCSKLILKYTLIYFKYEDKDSLTNIFNNFVNSDIRKNINLEYIIEKELLNHLLNEETDILDKHAFLENILYILPIDEGFNKTLIDLKNYYSSILSKIDMLKREEFPEYGC